ncbi:MAG: nitroreductase/quinone reductase family protein, partial [Myxococcota bacterium]
WLRRWYHQALANPEVTVTVDGKDTKRIAVPIEGEERARVAEAYDFGLLFRLICGFAPNRFLRLDPVG